MSVLARLCAAPAVRRASRAWLARGPARGWLARRMPRLFLALAPDPDRDELGRVGEDLVARTLRAHGARIEGRRVRTIWGEIDLVASDARGVLVVEVKSSRLAPRPRIRGAPPVPLAAEDRPGARVDARTLARLERAAAALGARRGAPGRVEVWEVLAGPGPLDLLVRRGGSG